MSDRWEPSEASRRTAERIVSDLRSRKGLGNEWDEIEPDIQEDITDLWARIIEWPQRLNDRGPGHP